MVKKDEPVPYILFEHNPRKVFNPKVNLQKSFFVVLAVCINDDNI